jgi:hypothetical protein
VGRFVAIAVFVLLAVPAGANAVGGGAGDGTLAVSGATGYVGIASRGALIGQLDRGRVIFIDDPDAKDSKEPVVWGYESKRDISDTKALYSGTDIRFRISGGFFRVRVVGTGLDLSVVGRGSVTLGPALGLLTLGTYSLNDGFLLPFPDEVTSLQLAASAPGG